MEKKKKTMTKAEAFEWLKGKKVRCFTILDTNLCDKIFNKLQECGCYWRIDSNPRALFHYVDRSPDNAWALFIDDTGEISPLPIHYSHLYKELGGEDILFEDILSIEIVEDTPEFSYKKVVELAKPLMEYLNDTGCADRIEVSYDHIVAQPMATLLHSEMKGC